MICHFHARVIARRKKVWFLLCMNRILFVPKHVKTTLQVSRPLFFVGSYLQARGGGGGGYSHTLPIRVCAAQRGLHFEAPISEAFPRTGYNTSNARKLQFCKQPFETIQGQITFKNTVQCINKQTVILLLHPRTEYKKLAHF